VAVVGIPCPATQALRYIKAMAEMAATQYLVEAVGVEQTALVQLVVLVETIAAAVVVVLAVIQAHLPLLAVVLVDIVKN